jgi:hypothetical protein
MAWKTLPTIVVGDFGEAAWANDVKEDLDHIASDIVDTSTWKLRANTVVAASVTAGIIGQGKLKTTASETTLASAGETTVDITTDYAFHLRVYTTNTSFGYCAERSISEYSSTNKIPTGSYTHRYGIGNTTGGVTSGLYYRYVAACPPYDLDGSEPWWFFLWLLRDRSSGEVHSAHCADDPPWHFGLPMLPEDDPERILRKPHPWHIDYPDPAMLDAAGLEVVLLDLRDLNEETQAPTKELIQYESLLARHDERLAMGMSLEQVIAAEKKAELAALEEPSCICRMIESARLRADLANGGILDLIHGITPAVAPEQIRIVAAKNATREISKARRDMLPTVPIGPDTKRPWRDVVRVMTQA